MTTSNRPGKLRLMSLFSGCGGLDLGFEGGFLVPEAVISASLLKGIIQGKKSGDYLRLKPTRFETVFANDIVPEAKKVWKAYFSAGNSSHEIYHQDSIVDLVKNHYERQNVFPTHVDVITGGFPCQDFSLAGKRKGFSSHKDHSGKIIGADTPTIESRGALYMWMKEVIEITKPNMFIAENVKGLVNLSNVRDIIRKDFSSVDDNGYFVFDPMVLQAADYGVPQSRERVFFIGLKKSALQTSVKTQLENPTPNPSLLPFPVPTHAYSIKSKDLPPAVETRQIFQNLPEPDESEDPSHQYYSKAKYMGKHCQGQTEVNLFGVAPTIRSEHHGNIEFRRLSSNHGGKYTDELVHKGLPERRLTPRECALLQTFPPDFPFVIPSGVKKFEVSPSAAYKMIGNAVPPLLAYHLARRIESLWDIYFKGQS